MKQQTKDRVYRFIVFKLLEIFAFIVAIMIIWALGGLSGIRVCKHTVADLPGPCAEGYTWYVVGRFLIGMVIGAFSVIVLYFLYQLLRAWIELNWELAK
jgi:hypothetical protein